MAQTSRRKSRINAIKILYLLQQNDVSIKQAYDMLSAEENQDQENYIDEIAIDFATQVHDKLPTIDKLIEKSLVDYQLSRLNYVDLAIIRLCTMELLSGVEAPICINEAIDITKEFTELDDKKASKFNNRLLQTIKENIVGE